MDNKLADLTRAIQGNGTPATGTPAADPRGFIAMIIRIANDLYNMQRPDRRTRLMAGDELMALAGEMRAAFQAQHAEIAALKARIAMLEAPGGDPIRVGPWDDGTPIASCRPSDVPLLPSDDPVSIQPTPRPAKHEKARA